jgi:hypothetical protein
VAERAERERRAGQQRRPRRERQARWTSRHRQRHAPRERHQQQALRGVAVFSLISTPPARSRGPMADGSPGGKRMRAERRP